MQYLVTLTLGNQSDSTGTYNLVDGTLQTGATMVGLAGTGTLNQTGGTHTVTSTVALGHDSTGIGNYKLEGGDLISQGVAVNNGEFWQTSGTNTITNDKWLTVSANPGGEAKYTMDGGTLETFGEDIGSQGPGTFTQNDGEHRVTANIPGQGLRVGGAAPGYFYLRGGSLETQELSISNGEFLQQAGTMNTVGRELNIIANPGGSAKYTLEGGTLDAASEWIGREGSGTFIQQDGDHTVSGTNPGQGLMMGGSAPGYFNLEGGTLNTYNVGVGQGVFRQLAGTTNTIGNQIVVSTTESGESKYSLEGGDLFTNNIIVGLLGHGEFQQDPGSTHTVSGGMNIGSSPSGTGQYTLAGGSLSFGSGAQLKIGNQGIGTFMQTGGEVSWTPSVTVWGSRARRLRTIWVCWRRHSARSWIGSREPTPRSWCAPTMVRWTLGRVT